MNSRHECQGPIRGTRATSSPHGSGSAAPWKAPFCPDQNQESQARDHSKSQKSGCCDSPLSRPRPMLLAPELLGQQYTWDRVCSGKKRLACISHGLAISRCSTNQARPHSKKAHSLGRSCASNKHGGCRAQLQVLQAAGMPNFSLQALQAHLPEGLRHSSVLSDVPAHGFG